MYNNYTQTSNFVLNERIQQYRQSKLDCTEWPRKKAYPSIFDSTAC